MNKALIVSAVLVLAGTACSKPAEQRTPAYDPGLSFEGRSAADLSAEWWQWAIAAPEEINPVHDETGIHCAVGQQGNVWFLAGGFGPSKITRHCTVPAGKHLFFPIINMAFWPDEPGSDLSCEQARAAAALHNDSVIDLFVEVDGVPIKDPKQLRANTQECFDISARIPAEEKSYSAYPSATDGYWVLLPPLSKGKHTLKFGGSYASLDTDSADMLQDIEYELLVE